MFKNAWQGNWNGRLPAGDVHQRARKVITPSGGIVRGKFPSRKNGRMVHHEGLLELDAIYLFETSFRIQRYREQPATYHYPDGARLRRYTPDFELVLNTGELVIIEVKPLASIEHEDVRHKLDCISSYMRNSGIVFMVLTNEVIRQEPRLSNLRWIYHQSPRITPTPEALINALNQQSQYFPTTLSHANNLLETATFNAYSLILSGYLTCDVSMSMTPETMMNIEEENHHESFWISQEYGF
jgi:hypothetical protein